ncbi:D-glycero-beta-D-manno-heptose-7-phosphate kinase [Kaistia dalseonensis]|uniref:Bifunctional protein HldE n=2 Tax=Kaistia dalseonensis TaxID=410840 RepID=A0ABU0H3X6_9HYPH|nr:D-glycero-beta-D-manno-heptose-7-phosphate kinase [Kaistia dalseonensis]MDQ0436214.1 D-beta-D-heptose 7-phosphate kinase/D-beta-D-heptose 1-phosphate adenosyltransferase [Kaistia dalseonensis]
MHGTTMLDERHTGRVAVIGDVMIDRYITGSVNRISPEAPVPVLLHSAGRVVAGGAANVAANVSALGARVHLVGLVGADNEARELRDVLGQHGVTNLAGLVVDPARPTVTKTRVMSGRQQIVRIDAENTSFPGTEIEAELVEAGKVAIADADVVVLSDYAKGVLSDRVITALITEARSRNVPIIVDPKRRTFEAYRGATLVTPNRKELFEATGLPDDTDETAAIAAAAAAGQFGGDVLVTRAEKGMTLWRQGGAVTHVPAEAREVFDVSGAGDTALAALAVSIAEGLPVESAVGVANAAAAIAVGKLGTAVVTRAELNAALNRTPLAGFEPGALAERERAAQIVRNWQALGERVVFTNGCFDLVHPGHIAIIELAANEGDRLVVGLNTDSSVKRLKGPSRPLQDEIARARVIGALRAVDLVVLFEEDTPLEIIQTLKPDVLVKGADYQEHEVVGADFVKAHGGRLVLAPIVPGRSTSALVKLAKS